MKYPKKLILSILLVLGLTARGQNIEYFRFYAGVSFMPAGGFKTEIYENWGGKFSHFSVNLFYKKPKKITKIKLPTDNNFDLVINDFDSLSKLKSFTFAFDKYSIEKIKNDTFEKNYHHLKDIDIDNFF